MKKAAYFIFFIASLVLTSCGAGKGHFKIEGKFLHMNQGEFYVYSPDGVIQGMDTIKVMGGDFAYEIPCNTEGTLMLVFPNFSETPIFAESGGTVNIKADASHLKEIEISGTKPNNEMNDLRKQFNKAAPPEAAGIAEEFIKENKKSIVSTYLIRKYFMQGMKADYKKAVEYIDLLLSEQKDNGILERMKLQAESLKTSELGAKLPAFTDTDIQGKLVSSVPLASAPYAVIYVWSYWNYESRELQRQIKDAKKRSKGKLAVLGICAEANIADCKTVIRQDSITTQTICDGKLLENKTIKKLGLTAIPDNIILQNGKVIAKSLTIQEMRDKLNGLFK